MTTTPPVPPAQAGEALKLKPKQYEKILKAVLSPRIVNIYLAGDYVALFPADMRAIIDKAYAAGRQHAPAEPVTCGQFENPFAPKQPREPILSAGILNPAEPAIQPVQGLPDSNKQWCMNMAKLEDGMQVGAISPDLHGQMGAAYKAAELAAEKQGALIRPLAERAFRLPDLLPRLIPDAECKQGKCAMNTTGCLDKCYLESQPYTVIVPQQVLSDQPPLKEREIEKLQLAYGLLWHSNAGLGAPSELNVPSLPPAKAAQWARGFLFDMLTQKQRGEGIEVARAAIEAERKQKGGA